MCLIGIGFVLRLWIKPLRDLQTIILRIGAGDAHVRAAAKGSPELVDLAQALMPCWTKSITSCNRLRKGAERTALRVAGTFGSD